MKDTGKTTCSMDTARRYGLITPSMRANIMRERSTEKVHTFGQTVQDMKVTGSRIESRVMGPIPG